VADDLERVPVQDSDPHTLDMQAFSHGCKTGGGVGVGGRDEFLAIDEAARAGIRHRDAHDQAREG
jgi:hypothetical protein